MPPLSSLGKDEAEALMVRVWKSKARISTQDKEARQFAADSALKHIDSISTPPWQLINEVSDATLFEALYKKFKDNLPKSDYAFARAKGIYVISLVVTNKSEEAASFVLENLQEDITHANAQLNFGNLTELQQKGYGKQVVSFLQELLNKNAALPLWTNYIELSALEGMADKALEFQESILKKTDLTASTRSAVENHYYSALLAADRVDEGIKLLRTLVQNGPRKLDSTSTNDTKEKLKGLGIEDNISSSSELNANLNQEHLNLSIKLLKIGVLLKQPEWVDEGLTQTLVGVERIQNQPSGQIFNLDEIIKLMVKLNKGPEAEELLKNILINSAKVPENQRYRFMQDNAEILAALAYIYHEAGRHKDVLALLDESPQWGVKDILEVSASTLNLSNIAATALLKEGKKTEATKLTDQLLINNPGDDKIYQLLIQLNEPADTIRKLDEQFKKDRFQERPLIWKAKLQLEAGDVEGADKTIKAAIAIDPSDGEQGKGDRMRAYSVLADILEKKGDAEQAKLMRGAVTAIRLSEDADDYWEAGLLKRAVAMYEESLEHFADAYCIQSRLAVVYNKMGEYDKAEAHYLKAFELMPDSFGRVESHCFGCEGAFNGKQAQGVAERVFQKLADEKPDKAQVFYLLGYLRESQQRFADAAEQYRKAVKLDPDYLNALKKLQSLAQHIKMEPKEQDEIALALFRLDPYGKHSSRSLSSMRNLRLLWDTILASETKFPDSVANEGYPLAASSEALKKNPERSYRSSSENPRKKLLMQLSENPAIQSSVYLFESTQRMR